MSSSASATRILIVVKPWSDNTTRSVRSSRPNFAIAARTRPRLASQMLNAWSKAAVPRPAACSVMSGLCCHKTSSAGRFAQALPLPVAVHYQ